MSNGKTFNYQFPNSDSAQRFLCYANSFDVVAQHPFQSAQTQDSTKVMVVSKTQSMTYNINLLKSLETMAESCNGTRIWVGRLLSPFRIWGEFYELSSVIFFTIIFNAFCLSTIIVCPQPKHFNLKSTPTLVISHSLLPHGCCFFVFTISPILYSIYSHTLSIYILEKAKRISFIPF